MNEEPKVKSLNKMPEKFRKDDFGTTIDIGDIVMLLNSDGELVVVTAFTKCYVKVKGSWLERIALREGDRRITNKVLVLEKGNDDNGGSIILSSITNNCNEDYKRIKKVQKEVLSEIRTEVI